MTDPLAASADQSSLLMDSVEVEIGNLAKHQTTQRSNSPLETNAERTSRRRVRGAVRSSLQRGTRQRVDGAT
jgi:hypothetical protein